MARLKPIGQTVHETCYLEADRRVGGIDAFHGRIGIVRELLFDHLGDDGIGEWRMYAEALAMLDLANALIDVIR